MLKPVLTYPIVDKQTVIDYVYQHFIVEKNSLVLGTEYNTDSGGCAIGCLLPPDFRQSIPKSTKFKLSRLHSFDSVRAESPSLQKIILEMRKLFSPDLDFVLFLIQIQNAHDNSVLDFAAAEKNFIDSLQTICKQNQLTLKSL